ncbi:MAG: NAD(P)H-dependent oxidoreductase [Verrucomicrobia bacterium]|nr:NAD(P)H-dependent oxidoreductase [Cytophagales bacterium]
MIVIVVGTNRPNAVSKQIAAYYQYLLSQHGQKSMLLDLENLPDDFTKTALYLNSGKNEAFNQLKKVMEDHHKFVFVIPEYNGSFPGVLKAFIDGLKYPDSMLNKKAALVGVSTGVQGASLALSHFSDVLSYLNVNQIGLQVKLGSIKQHLQEGKITFDIYNQLLEKQIQQLLVF